MEKKVLLIAGGGTLGTYTAKELLVLGYCVDIVCLKHDLKVLPDTPALRFFEADATDEYITDLLSREHYDGIVNFLHYEDVERYKKMHPLLVASTDHLIFLSSYRVYADEQHPITESAPRLLDVSQNEEFLKTETYAIRKAVAEDFLHNECVGDRYTIVRPVISFSNLRFDLLMNSAREVLEFAARGEAMRLPTMVRDFKAGLDWAGNSGKLIAHLLFKEEAIGETFTVSSGQGVTWGEVADYYTELVGLKINWCSEEEYLHDNFAVARQPWAWKYDRRYNRDVDVSKILRVTGLTASDFTSVKDGIRIELENMKMR